MKLTQSVLAAAGDCQLKAQYTLDKPTWAVREAGSVRAVGTGYHAGLELRYAARIGGKTEGLPLLDDMIGRALEVFTISQTTDLYDNTPIDQFKWDEQVPDMATAAHFMSEMLTHYMTDGHEWPLDWQVLAVELASVFPDDAVGWPTKLGADLALQAPDGGIVLVDHKTAGKPWPEGKAHPRKNVQSAFYTRLAKIQFPMAPYHRFVFDVITYPRPRAGTSFQRLISDPTVAHESAIFDRAVSFIAVYDQVHVKMGLNLPANPASTLCNEKWCPFFEGCPFGRALEI